MSRWGGELTDQEAQDMIAQGIELIIVGTGHPNGAGTYARQQAETWLRNGGKHLDAYIYLYMAWEADQQVAQGLGTLQGLPVRMWWLDAEDVESQGLTPEQRVAFLHDCLDNMGGLNVGIYTGRWWWVPNMADSTEFSHLPLWNSWYDGDPDTDGVPYGGWTDSLIEQYEGTTNICGQSVDLNYAKNLELLQAEEEEMTDEMRGILEDILSRITKLEDVLAGGRAGVDYQWSDQGNFMLGLAQIQAKLAKIEQVLEN